MAQTSNIQSGSFEKSLSIDAKDFHKSNNQWTYARNAVNNSITGDIGNIGNEASNVLCTSAPYPIIGTVQITSDYWLVFSTNNVDSEIGIFKESDCLYLTIANSPCLSFKTTSLIKGVSRALSTCSYKVYWDDGTNPSRVIQVVTDDIYDNLYTNSNSTVDWIQIPNSVNNCITYTNTPQIDCNKIRLADYILKPCIKVKKGVTGGTLLNGSYMLCIAYAVDGQKVSDWYISNVQGLFEHTNAASSLDVEIVSMDNTYDEILVGIISTTNLQTVCRLAGTYNTRQNHMSFDTIDSTWPTIPIEQIPLMNTVFEKSDAMYDVNNYLLRVGPTTKFDFNYQPLANQIIAKWVSVEYKNDYYRKGGNNTQYLRDEVYAFFLRWVYTTGDRTASYHLPGRPKNILYDMGNTGTDLLPDEVYGWNEQWRVVNTAIFNQNLSEPTGDGGLVIAEGYMGYWESTELYPDDKPEIWNSNVASLYNNTYQPTTALNLCGQPIRHHRFPENFTSVGGATDSLKYTSSTGEHIRLLGVKFENIKYPVDNNGIPIPGIVGYEILRGTRNGNKTIIAKGIINNMGVYNKNTQFDETAFPAQYVYYQNYPYNDLHNDPFLLNKKSNWNGNTIQPQVGDGYDLGVFSDSLFTFHSPETNFTDPFLAGSELKVYGEMTGEVTGEFSLSEEHPKGKLIANSVFLLSALAGLGVGAMSIQGKKTVTEKDYEYPGLLIGGSSNPDVTAGAGRAVIAGIHAIRVMAADLVEAGTVGELGRAFLGANSVDIGNPLHAGVVATMIGAAAANWGASTPAPTTSYEQSGYMNLPSLVRTIFQLPMFIYYFAEGTDSMMRLLESVIKYRDYALRYHSHGFYDNMSPSTPGHRRRAINQQEYIGSELTRFSTNIEINNLFRHRVVVLNTHANLKRPNLPEVTRFLASEISDLYDGNDKLISPMNKSITNGKTMTTSRVPTNMLQKISSHYVALKQRINNQYGQINNIKQVIISNCMQTPPESTKPTNSNVLFGGDTYIGRYTEKNTFFYFYDWMYNKPDGTEFDYTKHYMIPFPRFWANFEKYETTEFTSSVFTAIGDFISNIVGSSTSTPDIKLPDDKHALDGLEAFAGLTFRLSIKHAWFYLFNSGVRDFYVESEYNLDCRDWGNDIPERHYDEMRGFAGTREMFNTKYIKSGNYYKYDQSLSISKLFINYLSWGNIQPRNYDPYLAETCYQYIPTRVIYSLPAQYESIRDNWTLYLANNYKDFISKVSAVKPVSKSGAIILFESDSPVNFVGVDTLETTAGTKLTIGDGGLFNQPLQSLTNADKAYEHGSCQNRLSVINTPFGVFWISQSQGKVFQYTGSLIEISNLGLKWWFAEYLPYKITNDFPDYDYLDNPVVGVGCQTIYDNTNNIVYFCKRDFVLKEGLNVTIDYVSNNTFTVDNLDRISLGDSRYFEDASWTISFDPKINQWISFHDWHPNLFIPSKETFYTTQGSNIWLHNKNCQSYCNFYGIDYPWEIEYSIDTVQNVNTLRSIEYQLEVYKYADNCFDRHHVLDVNFDEAVVYNTEQVSGMLRLVLTPKNRPNEILTYPRVYPDRFDILYSKEEQKYRFNQFYDITHTRGEFDPNAKRVIWDTQANGYIRVLNDFNLNYAKPSFQHKKFRHYSTRVLLRRRVSGENKMILRITNNKNITSLR